MTNNIFPPRASRSSRPNARPTMTAHEAALYLQEEMDDFSSADIFLIPPPEAGDITDEDSGDEESNCFDHLSAKQLNSGVSISIRHHNGEKEVVGEEDYDQPPPELYEEDLPPPESTLLMPRSRKRRIQPSTSSDPSPQPSTSSDPSPQPSASSDPPSNARKVRVIPKTSKWVKRDLKKQPQEAWNHSKKSEPYLINPLTPTDFFELYFDDDIIEDIVGYTMTYAGVLGDHAFTTDAIEIRAFLGILLCSGYSARPRRKHYWESQEDMRNPMVANTMSRNRFDTIFQYFKTCNNLSLNKDDKMAKVRPLFNHLNEKCLQFFPMETSELSVDESMVPYYGRHSSKQFIKSKPIRYGFKVWRLCTPLGYIVQFEPYCGAGEGKVKELGIGGSVVVNLLAELPIYRWHVTFDNFFTSMNLLGHLHDRGIHAVGTVRADRTLQCPVKPKEIKKKERGHFDYRKLDKENIVVCSWNDNSAVTIASNSTSILPTSDVQRWSKVEKKFIFVQRPNAIKVYNKTMGGVDRADQNIAMYRISMRQKKWYWCLVADCIDAMVQNAWQLHR